MDFYNQALQKSTFNLDSTEIIILVPGSGCSGCITKAEHFIAKYFNKLNKVKFILTNIQSYKILRLKLGEEAFIHLFCTLIKIMFGIIQKMKIIFILKYYL